MKQILAALALTLIAPAAFAETATRIPDKGSFVNIVEGRDLTRFAVRLNVSPAGSITGRAFGRDVIGSWTWEDGFFCRAMTAGSTVLERNCQAVYQMDGKLRFIADRGTGDTADLAIE